MCLSRVPPLSVELSRSRFTTGSPLLPLPLLLFIIIRLSSYVSVYTDVFVFFIHVFFFLSFLFYFFFYPSTVMLRARAHDKRTKVHTRGNGFSGFRRASLVVDGQPRTARVKKRQTSRNTR